MQKNVPVMLQIGLCSRVQDGVGKGIKRTITKLQACAAQSMP